MVRLLADCGNTTVKLGLAHDGGIWTHARLAAEEPAFDAFVASHDAAIAELVVMPGSHANTARVVGWWARIGRGRPLRVIGEAIPAPGLGQYAGCGIDRVLAGLVGCTQEHASLVIVDAGTATTITAWRFTPAVDPFAAVRFAGGLILPAARTCLAGLHLLAPALPAVEPLGPDAAACQHDTVGAIAAAMGIGYGPMVAACLIKLERETGIRDQLATGGNCQLLIDSDVIPRLAYRPSLVLEGVEMVARRADGEAANDGERQGHQ